MITNPIMPNVLGERLYRSASPMNPKPMAAMTWNKNVRKWMSYQTQKLTMVSSSTTRKIPRVKRNRLLSLGSVRRCMDSHAEVPERKTKLGAHRCVIQRVKKRMGVVVFRSVGLWIRASVCIRSLVWSRAMMIITNPRAMSME